MDGCVSWCFENEGLETNTRARGLLTPGYQSQLALSCHIKSLDATVLSRGSDPETLYRPAIRPRFTGLFHRLLGPCLDRHSQTGR
jgi:hypothetical protein